MAFHVMTIKVKEVQRIPFSHRVMEMRSCENRGQKWNIELRRFWFEELEH